MTKFVLILILVAAGAPMAHADQAAPDQGTVASSIGGGVAHPWRSPYKTALVDARVIPLP